MSRPLPARPGTVILSDVSTIASCDKARYIERYPQAPGTRPSPAPQEKVAEREARNQVRVAGSCSLPSHPPLSPVLRARVLGVLETGDEAGRSLHMVLQ